MPFHKWRLRNQIPIPIALVSFAIGLIIALITALTRISVRKRLLDHLLQRLRFILCLAFPFNPVAGAVVHCLLWTTKSDHSGHFPHGIKLDPVVAGIITFSLNTGAYCAETIRAALLSIDHGQWEAAYSVGLPRRLVLREIIIPQALRTAVPPLSNSFISLVKDTSLAASITIVEMFQVSQQIAAENYQPLLMYSLVALLYAVVCTALTWGQRYLEKVTSRYTSNVQTTQL